MPKLTYKIGATAWSLTVEEPNGSKTVFDISAMDKNERGHFFGTLRRALRKKYA